MKPHLRRIAFVAAGLMALAAVVLLLRPDPVPVEVVRVDRGPLEITIDDDGTTRVQERYVISAPVTGHLERLACQVGDTVAQGQVVARIRPLPLDTRAQRQAAERLRSAEATRDAARARLERAQTTAGQAHRTLERLEKVRSRVPGAVAEERLDDARSAAAAAATAAAEAGSALDAAEHDVAASRAALAGDPAAGVTPTRVASPAAGRVLRAYEECERVVAAGSPILEVGDPGSLEVVVDLLTDDAVRVDHGAPARVTIGDGPVLNGRVERVEPSAFTRVSPLGVEEQRVNVVVRLDEADVRTLATDPAPGSALAVGDRFRVEVSLVVWRADDAVRVPVSALFRHDGGWGVFTVDDGRARLRPVELGPRGRHHAQVRSGVPDGAPVVRFPPEALTDGARVRVREAGA